MAHNYGKPVSPLRTGLTCKCPTCGEGKLFKGYLDVRENCPVCGQDFSEVNSGDGPAVFIILIVGFVVAGLAVWTELAFSPPYWLQLAIWLPTIFILSIGLLRPFKAFMVALQFKHKAGSDLKRY
ncbi:DUF983 domain-containing protein [Sneathiella sp.]|uniref:DUF983 domain-containing protein n=1 Tax=Sneathiella sp. TaxID=1964365 RepID=UPI003561BE27